MRKLILGLLCGAMLLGSTACTVFEVTTPDGLTVRTSGAPLVSRNDKFTVTLEVLNAETNNLDSFRISRNTEEQADAQIEAMRIMSEMAFRAGAGGLPVAP